MHLWFRVSFRMVVWKLVLWLFKAGAFPEGSFVVASGFLWRTAVWSSGFQFQVMRLRKVDLGIRLWGLGP